MLKKIAATAFAAVLATGGLLVVGLAAAPAAQAATKVVMTPSGPYTSGQQVTIKVTGYTPGAPVAIGQCKKGRVVVGPGDCSPSKTGGAKLTTIGADGSVTVKVKMIVGSIQNTKPPIDSCGPGKPCVLAATNISNNKETFTVPLTYVGAAAPAKAPAKTPAKTSATKTTTKAPATNTTTKAPAANTTTTAPSTGSGGSTAGGTSTTESTGATTAADTGSLPKTGPRETALIALVGLAIFQVGLIVAVRAARATPRRISL